MLSCTGPAVPEEPVLHLQVLGAPAVVARGQRIPLSLKRGIALLAFLAYHPGPVPREHVATLLWPDAEAVQGRARLRRLAYTLEKAAGCEMLASGNDCLSLVHASVETDALQFARFARRTVASPELDENTLAQACQWIVRARRPLMDGIAFGSAAFDDWLRSACI